MKINVQFLKNDNDEMKEVLNIFFSRILDFLKFVHFPIKNLFKILKNMSRKF